MVEQAIESNYYFYTFPYPGCCVCGVCHHLLLSLLGPGLFYLWVRFEINPANMGFLNVFFYKTVLI